MRQVLIFIVLFSYSIGISQTSDILRGKIVSDSTTVESINILNRSKGIGTINDEAGFFEIAAEVGDTLLFSSIRHQQKLVIVTKKALQSNLSKIKLDIKINELDEVRISQYDLSGEATEDVNTIKTYENNLPMFNAKQLDETPYIKEMGVKTIKNQVVFDEMSRTPVNFIAAFRMISSIFKKKKSENKQIAIPKVSNFYSEDFLVNELKVQKEKVYDFFDFVNSKKETKAILTSGNDLKVIEYLTTQSKIFKEQQN